MNSHSQEAVFLLRLLINVAPVAVYFLTMGLVNTQSRPRLVSGRSDFIALTLVFVPVLVWPVPILVQYHLWWVLATGILVGGFVFWMLLPPPWGNWVIYNITERRCRRLLDEALGRLGLSAHHDPGGLTVESADLRIDLSSFGLLNNVTLYFSPIRGARNESLLGRIRHELGLGLEGVALLPSATGACLVMVGVGLLIVPLWMMSRHMDAIVEIVSRLLSA
jgi:hypothetical protein